MDFFNLPCILSCLDIVSLWAYETVFLILSHPLYAPSPAHSRGQLCIPFYQLHNWFAESFSILIRDMSEPIPWAWFPSNRKWRTTKAMRIIYHLQEQTETTASKKTVWNYGVGLPSIMNWTECPDSRNASRSILGYSSSGLGWATLSRLGCSFGYGNASRSSHAPEKWNLGLRGQCLPDPSQKLPLPNLPFVQLTTSSEAHCLQYFFFKSLAKEHCWSLNVWVSLMKYFLASSVFFPNKRSSNNNKKALMLWF